MGSKPVPLPPVDEPYLPQQPADQPYPPQQPVVQPYPPQQPVVQPYPPQQPVVQPYPPQQPADQLLPPPGYQPGYVGVAPVITQQPAAYQQTSNTTIVLNQPAVVEQRARNWSTGLCGCFEDCGSLCMGLWCPQFLLFDVSSRMGEGCCLPCCCPYTALMALRIKLRVQHNIAFANNKRMGIGWLVKSRSSVAADKYSLTPYQATTHEMATPYQAASYQSPANTGRIYTRGRIIRPDR